MTNPTPRHRNRGKLRRRVSSLLALGFALMAAGGLYAVAAPAPQTAVAQQDDAALVRQGEQLYNNHCISCHGANLQGITDRGPSLLGVGEAAVYFQVASGRMPAARQEAQAERKPIKAFKSPLGEDVSSLEAADALGAFIQANGGGPELPQERGAELRGDPSNGGELFRLNCASCHNFTGRGGALSSGKYAPNLDEASEELIYAAMLSGPQNMPKFSDRQLTPEEKEDIIAYIKSVTGQKNSPGGYALGGFGPISEALATFVIGMAVLIGVTLWIGAKA